MLPPARHADKGLDLQPLQLPGSRPGRRSAGTRHLALADLRCVLLRLQGQLARDDSRAARQLSLRVEQQLSALPRSRSHGYLSLADLTESASHSEAEIVSWVSEAAAACAKQERGWPSRLRG
jgi:hypothetical protein